MNELQSLAEATPLDNVGDRSLPAPIACPQAVPPSAVDVLESLSEAIYTLDAQWRFTYINARAEALLQRSCTELLGRNIWHEYPQSTESIFYREYHRAAEMEETVVFEAYCLLLDIWLSVRVSPLPSGFSVLLQDITKRKVAETEIQERAALVEASFDAVVEKTLEGIVTRWNPSATKLYGYTEQEAVGKHISLIIPPDHAEELLSIMERLRRGERIEAFETVRRHKNGSEIHVALMISPTHNAQGKIIGASKIARDITEQKRVTDALLVREARLSSIVSSVMDAIVSVDQDQHVLFFNAAAERMFRCSASDSIGRRLSDFLPERFRIRHAQNVIDFGNAGVTARTLQSLPSLVGLRFDGEEFPIEATISQIEMQGQKIYTAILRDMSERKRTEHLLKQMMDGAHCLFWQAEVTDFGLERLGWSIQLASEEAAQQFIPLNVPAGGTYADAWFHSRPLEDQERTDFYGNREVRAGRSYQQEFRSHSQDGTLYWLSENVRVETLGEGKWRCTGICTDITKRKLAEEATRALTRGAQCLLWYASVEDRAGTLHWDVEMEDEEAAQQFFPLAQPSGMSYNHASAQARLPEDDAAMETRSTAALRGGQREYTQQFRCLRADGEWRWLNETVSIETLTPGRWRCIGVCTDITAVKAAEIVLRRANEDLEARVEERTAQITEANAQLLAAKNEADRANLAKSEFLSRMSHELRTPLNSILGFGQLLNREALTPLQQESIGYILKGGRHLLDLINEVLDLARVEAGHIALSLEPIDLLEHIRETCDLVRPLAVERSIILTVDAASFRGRYVQADRQRLKQVLLNILSNAIKYNYHGGQVRIYATAKSEDRCGLAIQDTGPGLTSEEQRRLFTPFERLNAAHSGIEGTGLGLVLSRRLITAMDGSLTLESLPGKGTTFFLELPLALCPIETFLDHPIGFCEVQTDPSEKPNATLLYIEDNLSNMRLLEVLLRSRPEITLLPAMQGSVGLDLALQHAPDLILLDLHLPDMSGIEVLTRLQRSALTRDIPVIILSADATVSQIERLLRDGARAYLTKPLDIAEFLHTLDTWLAKK